MKLVMKVLFVIFILSIALYLVKTDIFGPRIRLEKNMSLEFDLGQEVDDWNQYFYLFDSKEGLLDDKFMTIYDDDINLNKPGNQYLYIKASDKAGNVSTRTFEIKVSTGYQHLDFENFINNQVITIEDLNRFNLQMINEPVGINDINSSNASIASLIGSQNLRVEVTSDDQKENGINMDLELPSYHKYYLKFDIKIDDNGNVSTNDLISLPTISNSSNKLGIELAVTGNNKLAIIDNVNNNKFIVKKSDLSKLSTVELELSIGDKLGSPDLVRVRLDDNVVYTNDSIDFGYEKFDQFVMSVNSDQQVVGDYYIYLDNIKLSMIKEDLVG